MHLLGRAGVRCDYSIWPGANDHWSMTFLPNPSLAKPTKIDSSRFTPSQVLLPLLSFCWAAWAGPPASHADPRLEAIHCEVHHHRHDT